MKRFIFTEKIILTLIGLPYRYFLNIERIFMFERKVSYFINHLQVLQLHCLQVLQSALRINDLQKVITSALLSKLCLLGWSLVAGSITLSRNNSSKLLLLCGVITAVEFNNSDGCTPEIPSTGESSNFGFLIKPGGGLNGYGPISLIIWAEFPLLLQFSSIVCGSEVISIQHQPVVLILWCCLQGVVLLALVQYFHSFIWCS